MNPFAELLKKPIAVAHVDRHMAQQALKALDEVARNQRLIASVEINPSRAMMALNTAQVIETSIEHLRLALTPP